MLYAKMLEGLARTGMRSAIVGCVAVPRSVGVAGVQIGLSDAPFVSFVVVRMSLSDYAGEQD